MAFEVCFFVQTFDELWFYRILNRSRNELKYFSTQTKKVKNPAKKNVIIMGRKTYFGVPESKRPLPERINIVLTSEPEKYTFPSDVIVLSSMEAALNKIQEPEWESQIENVWIVGGNSVYKEALSLPQVKVVQNNYLSPFFYSHLFY